MTKTQPTVISVKGDDFIQKESLSDEAITPGHLLEVDVSTGNVKKLTSDIANNTENISILIALENSILGEGITDDYASGDTVRYAAAKSGQEFLLRLPDGQVIVVGDRLQSNGEAIPGTVIKAAASDAAIAIAKEALTASGEVFILAEVI